MTQRGKQTIINYIEAIGGIKKIPKEDRYLLIKGLVGFINEFERHGLYDKFDKVFPFTMNFHGIEKTPLVFEDSKAKRIEFNTKWKHETFKSE